MITILYLLTAISAALVLTGTYVPNHELYYPAVLALMLSGTLEMLELSQRTRSRKCLALTTINMLTVVIIAVIRMITGTPIISSADWQMGVFILGLYVIDIAIYAWYFLKQNGPQRDIVLSVAAIALPPFIAMIMFYAGTQAWISLSMIVLCNLAYLIVHHSVSAKQFEYGAQKIKK